MIYPVPSNKGVKTVIRLCINGYVFCEVIIIISRLPEIMRLKIR